MMSTSTTILKGFHTLFDPNKWSSGSEEEKKQSMYIAVAAAATTIVAVVALQRRREKRRDENGKDKPTLRRNWSFTSEGMRNGVFPESVQAPATIINAAMYFDKLPSAESLVDEVVRPLLQYDRFFMIPCEGGLRPSQTGYQPHDLVRTITVVSPKKDDDAEKILHETMYELLQDPVNVRGRNNEKNLKELPFWELVRIEAPGTKSVVLFRVHHCLGDGLALISVFDKIVTQQDGSRTESRITKALASRDNLPQPNFGAILEAIVHVLTLAQSKYDDATLFYQQRTCTKLHYNPPDHKLKIELFPTVPMEFFKHLRNATKATGIEGITINDLLMCAISQAIHDYCKTAKDDVLADKKQALQCRALLPVSLPRKSNSQERALCNRFCMVSADLSVGYTTVKERLQQIHATTNFLKTSPRPFIQLWIQNHVVNKFPRFVAQQTAHDIFSRHSLVLTNVPGPETMVKLAGESVVGLQLLFPNVIPQVDFLSYAGNIYGNMLHDPTKLGGTAAAVGDSHSMARLYAQALVQLGMEFSVVVPTVITDAAA